MKIFQLSADVIISGSRRCARGGIILAYNPQASYGQFAIASEVASTDIRAAIRNRCALRGRKGVPLSSYAVIFDAAAT